MSELVVNVATCSWCGVPSRECRCQKSRTIETDKVIMTLNDNYIGAAGATGYQHSDDRDDYLPLPTMNFSEDKAAERLTLNNHNRRGHYSGSDCLPLPTMDWSEPAEVTANHRSVSTGSGHYIGDCLPLPSMRF